MPKLIIVGRRRPGATRAEAQSHLMHVHGRMVIDPPADAGAMPGDYIQNHVFDGAYPPAASPGDPYALERDLVTELWFESPQALGAATSTPYYRTCLQPDEDNFVDRSTVAAALYDTTPRTAPEAGPFKLFVALNPVPGTEPQAFLDALDAATADPAAFAGARDVVRNLPLPRSGGAPFAALLEFWFDDAASTRAFATHEVPALHGRFPPGLLNPSACLHLLAEEFTTQRLRALHAAA